jgi:PKD repeat protein
VFTAPGLYTVTLTVSDGLESRSVTRTLEAAPLTIRSDVRHTPEWRDIHQSKGHQIDVAPKDFYSGEVFVVETVSSPAPVAEAVAWIDAQGKSGKALYASATLTARADSAIVFEGELFDEMWMSETDGFPEGVMPVHFRIRYANGVVKTEDVPIRIIGNVYEAVNVHRRQ